ncbi:MAG: hypothetical protein ACNA7O_14310 [Rhodobacterales bacterium]
MIAAIDNDDGKVVAVAAPDTKLADVLALVPMGEGVRASRRWRRPNRRGAEHGEIGVHLHRLGDGMQAELGESVDNLHRRDAFKGGVYIGFAEVSS